MTIDEPARDASPDASAPPRPATGAPEVRLTRREVLAGAVAAPLAGMLGGAAAARGQAPAAPTRRPRVVVVGAGAFGGWTALALRRRGAEVTLLDAWGPGNSRSSSGGETRVIRGMYGADALYTDWVVRSFALWRELEERCGEGLYRRTGALWMFEGDDGYARAALPVLRAAGLPASELDLAAARKRFPQVDFGGVRSVFVEEEAGYLTARRACQAVARALAAEGGELRQAAVGPQRLAGGSLERLALLDGSSLRADAYVFACGPWLGELLPDVVGQRIAPTRQEVFYFGTPPGDSRFAEGEMPVWITFGERVVYGVPGNEHRGFKVADDTRGEPVHPTSLERATTSAALAAARALLARRFPALASAPLLGAEVCQYENSPDGHFLLDRHPAADNVWLAGGGSGHGFKLGPAVGEHVAALVSGEREPLAQFALARMAEVPAAPKTQMQRDGRR